MAWNGLSMILPLLELSSLLFLSVGAGYTLLRPLAMEEFHPSDRLFLAAAAGLGVISTMMAGLGVLGGYNRAGYAGGGLILLIGSVPAIPSLVSDLRAVGRSVRKLISESRLSAFLVALVAFHGMVLLFAAFSPVYGYDALDRHLSVAKEYLQAGGFIPLTHIWGGDSPNQGVMLYIIGLALGEDRLAQFINIYALVCGVLGTFILSRPLRSSSLRVGACLVMISLPATTQYMASPYLDVYVQVWMLAMWIVLSIYATRRRTEDLLFAGLFGGMAAAVKYQGCVAFASLVVFAIAWLRIREEPWLRTLGRMAICAAVGSLPVGFWLAKSAWLTGNPVYPFLYTLFGGINWSAESALAWKSYLGLYTLPFTPVGFFRSIWRYLFGTSVYMGNLFGPFFLFGLFVAISPPLRRRVGWLALFGLFQLLTFFHFSTQIRYIYHAMPFLAISAMGGLGYALDRFRSRRVLLLTTAGLLYAINLLYALSLDGFVAHGVIGTEDRDSYLIKRVQYYDAYLYINANLPSDAGILIPRSFGYYLDCRYLPWQQKDQGFIIHRMMVTPNLLRQRLDALGLSYVVEDNSKPYNGILKELLLLEGELVYEGPRSSVYALGERDTHVPSNP